MRYSSKSKAELIGLIMKEVNVTKKLMVLILALVLLVPLSAACTGPGGPDGARGAAGPAGPAGAAGEPGTPASAACIVITPTGGKASTTIAISGAGFVPGEKVELVLNIEGVDNILGTRGLDGPLVANEYGAFSVISRIPNVKPPTGMYAMKARGETGTMAFSPLEVTE